MSYKALLFCPDEAAARLVTQVLSELEFTVELSFEPFLTVKKLTEEPFDALVVDCADEQNASLLFKGARNSNLNHSSLCVAVAEGQAGVANAFRIGANLVLTKPINIEQSKNTLRVAKGLLRKSVPQARPATPSTETHNLIQGSKSDSDAAGAPLPKNVPNTAGPAPAPPATPAAPRAMPSSLLEAEQVKAPAESMGAARLATPHSSGANLPASSSKGFSAGAAAAPAMAPERPRETVAPRLSGTPPLVTQDPIIAERNMGRREMSVPSFALLAPRPAPSKGGIGKLIVILACLAIASAGGYFGWKKYQPMRYIHLRTRAASSIAGDSSQSAPSDEKPSPEINERQTGQQSNGPSSLGSNSQPTTAEGSSTLSGSANAPIGFPTKESIDVTMPSEDGSKDKPEPIQVSNRAPKRVGAQLPAAAPTPPQLDLPGAKNSDSALAGIVAANPALPKPNAQQDSLRISQGITQGLLMSRVSPAYPPVAMQMRKEGTVELLAFVSKTGSITKIKVLSGDPTFAKAAVDAVRQWKYRPYLLNGEPVDIETQITVNFRLPH